MIFAISANDVNPVIGCLRYRFKNKNMAIDPSLPFRPKPIGNTQFANQPQSIETCLLPHLPMRGFLWSFAARFDAAARDLRGHLGYIGMAKKEKFVRSSAFRSKNEDADFLDGAGSGGHGESVTPASPESSCKPARDRSDARVFPPSWS